MTEYSWISIVALLGWLILAVSAWRSYRVSGKRMLMYILIWGSIFVAVMLFFMAIGK